MQQKICQQIEVKEITNKEIWEDFLKEIEEKTFLQSWAWGEFQKAMEEKVWRLGIIENEKLIAVALIILVKAKRGSFLLVPHGPLIKQDTRYKTQDANKKTQILKILLKELKEIAKEEKASFIRINPTWERAEENAQAFKNLGFKDAPIHIHPEATWQLDVMPPEEELLKNMRKTTRYLIRKAERDKNIGIIQSRDIKDVELFSQLHREVSVRQNFIPFSLKYLKNEFSAFQKDDQISLFIGEYKGKIVASSFLIFYSGKAFYHHAALLKEYSRVPISYLILWEAIKETKRRKFSFFDFWGYVSPKENPNHPWAGPTLFKMGFGGEKREYVKTQDFPISKKYWLTYAFEKLRKRKRNL